MFRFNFDQLAKCTMELPPEEPATQKLQLTCSYAKCGKEFEKVVYMSRRRQRHYCSPGCHNADRNQKVEVTCTVCTKVTLASPSIALKTKTCLSDECKAEARRRATQRRHEEHAFKMPVRGKNGNFVEVS